MTEHHRSYWVEARDPETGQLMERSGPVDVDAADIIEWAVSSRHDIRVVSESDIGS